ncbi:MAG: TRAP transporter small permease [Synergistaceae bacterium]|jgi:TRAP-type C4-dicarboxylate transport system permease small subunit|nr:TRAP transporter small permease [Synergistaceae bacterium]
MLKKIWDHLEEIFLLPSLVFSVGLIFVQIIMRYVFTSSLSWSEELARYLFIWQIWLGVSYAARNRSHLRILLLTQKLSPKARSGVELVVTAVWMGFALFVAARGFGLAAQVARFGQKSSALQIPMQYVHLAVPVGCTLMALRLAENTLKDFFSKQRMRGLPE